MWLLVGRVTYYVVMERTWVWYGGSRAIDFVNTRRRADQLRTPGDLAEWLRAAGSCADPGPVDDALFAQARRLRDAIDTLLSGPDDTAIETVNGLLAAPRLALSGGSLVLAEERDARHALSEIALDAARLLTSPDRHRVKTCPNPDCGGRFVDRSPAGRRRWCSMAVCGNRAKAARHRAAAQ